MEKTKIDEAIDYINIVGSLGFTYGDNCRLYNMTTENITSFLSKYDLKDKRVLTVGGSGDQRLNSYLLGASDVVCFDINPLSELHIKLKDAALKELDYEEFLDFFKIYGYKRDIIYDFLDLKLYKRIRNSLDDDALYFYDYVLKEKENFNCRELFFYFDDFLYKMQRMNNYLEEESFNKLKEIIKTKEVNFINSSVEDLDSNIKEKKFDMIMLSNISDYIHRFYQGNSLEKYSEVINEMIDNMLNLLGIIQVGYIYCFYSIGEDISNFHISEDRNIYFPSDKFKVDFVESYSFKGNYDKVVTYKKTKKSVDK